MDTLKISWFLSLVLSYSKGDIGYTCYDGFSYLAATKRCYKYIDDQVTQTVAQSTCEAIFATLVQMTAFDVEALIKQRRVIDGDSDSSVWLGMKYDGSTLKWTDLDVPVSNGYTHWDSTQPDTISRCAVMTSATDFSKWRSYPCTSLAGGIACEREPELKTDEVNIALGAEINMTFGLDGNLALDGIQKLDLSSCTTNAYLNDFWLVINLPNIYSIQQIGIFAKYPAANTQVHISSTCSDKDECWSRCTQVTTKKGTQWIPTCDAGYSNDAMYIQLIFPSSQTISICEIIVLGVPVSVTTKTSTTTTSATTTTITTSTNTPTTTITTTPTTTTTTTSTTTPVTTPTTTPSTTPPTTPTTTPTTTTTTTTTPTTTPITTPTTTPSTTPTTTPTTTTTPIITPITTPTTTPSTTPPTTPTTTPTTTTTTTTTPTTTPITAPTTTPSTTPTTTPTTTTTPIITPITTPTTTPSTTPTTSPTTPTTTTTPAMTSTGTAPTTITTPSTATTTSTTSTTKAPTTTAIPITNTAPSTSTPTNTFSTHTATAITTTTSTPTTATTTPAPFTSTSVTSPSTILSSTSTGSSTSLAAVTTDAVTTPHPDGQVLAWDSYGRAIRQKCTCRCRPAAVPTVQEEAVQRAEELQDDLAVETELLTTEIAKKVSKQDDRKSSNVIGMSGIVMLVLPFVFIVVPDLLTFLKWLCRCR